MSSAHPLLTIESESQADAHVIRIAGELDLGGRADLESALQGAERSQADRIIVDLEALTFIDSVGLGTLLTTSRRSASDGNRLEITPGKGQPAEILRLTGLEKVLPLADPALCPSIQAAGDASGARSMPDDANRPRTGEHVLVGANEWR
jgi:anti-sigma B factor antagonist